MVRPSSERRARAQGAGSTTLARAILVQSLIRKSSRTGVVLEEGQGARNEVLDGVTGNSTFERLKDTPLFEILYQSSKAEIPRGAIQVAPNNTFNIHLFEKADFSTLAHESSHFFLQVMIDLENAPNASGYIRSEMAKVRKWLGNTGEDISVEQHEKFARGFEQYLKEGKAPAPELRNIFRLFKQWLVKIYDGIKRSLNVKINDEIREVFDRILASDIEIEAAKKYHGIKPIFATPDEIGVTQEEFDAYVNLSKDSIEQAKEKLLQQLMKSQTRKATKEYKDLLGKATKEAEKEFDDTREARALNALTESEDRTTAVDSGSLSDYHKKIINSVQKMNGRKFHDRTGQRNIEDVAEEYGFNSGDELMTALTNLMPKKQYVENRAKEIVREREGDLLNSVTIAEEAEKALYSAEGREMLHKKELAVLQYMASIGDVGAKATEQQRSQELKRAKAIERGINALYGDMKLSAKEIISKKAVKEVKPSAYLAASRKYANKAKQALNKVNPDYVLAASCKRQQIMNECLYREARDAREQMEKEQARIRYIAKRPFEKYKNTRDHFGVLRAKFIAAKCGLGGNPEAIAKQMNEEKSVSGNGEAGYGFLDESIEYDAIGNYKYMSVAEFLYIASAIRAEYDMARRDKVVEIEGRRIEVEQAAGEVAEAINAYAESSNVIKTNRQENARNSLLRLIANEMLSMTRMEECCIRIDGVSYKRGEKLGSMMRLVYLPIKNAADRVRIKQQEYFKRLSEIVDEFGFRQETIDARELGYVFGKDTGYGKAELIHAILHTGNESNLERLILGGGGENNAWGTKDRETGYLDASRWHAFIARMIEEGRLTKEDFDRVQKIWDIFEDLKPDSQKAHKEVFGKTFSEITARPFSMMGTVYKGGYVPAIYDYKKTGTGEKQSESLTVESLINNTGLAMPKPQASWGKERVSGYYAPLLFDMSALKEHLRRQILFNEMAPVNRDVQKILNRSNVDKAFREYNPDFKRDVIKPFMSRAITQSMETGTNENSALNKIGRQLRMRAGVAAMFANVANVIEQATDMIAVFTIINKKYVYDAFSTVFSNKNEVIGKIMEESVYMRNRIDSEVMAANGRLEVALNPGRLRKADKWIQDHAYFMQSWLDRYLSSVVWTAAYNQATAGGNSHAEAIQIADSSVRRVLGANAAEDVSNFESGSAWKRVFTQFCGYFVQRANLVATELSAEKRHAGTTKQDIANLRAAQAMIVLSSVFMTAWVGAAIRLIASGGGYGDDDDRNFTTWLVDVFGWGSLDYVFSMGGWAGKGLQTVKDIGRSWTTGQSYNSGRLFTPPAIALIDNFAKSVYSLSSKRKPADEKVGDIIVDASRLMPGVPVLPNRVTGSAEYILDTMRGEVRPRDAYDFARGVVTGRPSKGTEVR